MILIILNEENIEVVEGLEIDVENYLGDYEFLKWDMIGGSIG